MKTSLVCLGALAFGVSSACELTAQTRLAVQRVAGRYSRPLDVQAPPGDRARIFIVSQNGTVHIVKDGAALPIPFLSISVSRRGNERGLLGLAFHPRYAQNGFVYVHYNRFSDGATMIDRFKVSTADADRVDPQSRVTVMGPISQPYSNHNGGSILFGRDGFLYVALGDGGSGGDPGCRAQNLGSLLGKILRIDVNVTGAGYKIPASNPFVGKSGRDEIWSFGWRNPWRMSFDRKTGDLYVGDVGQGAKEEISFQPASSKGGGNYGWKFMEGTNCFGSFNCQNVIRCNDPQLIPPIHELVRNQGRSITGGNVYRGCAIPDLQGTYFFGDYATNRIWSFRYDGTRKTDLRERTSELGIFPALSSFGEDADGELYIADLNGSVYKVVAAQAHVTDLGFGKVGGNKRVPKFTACGRLDRGSSATFSLRRTPPNLLAILVASSQRSAINIFQGTLVPFPPQAVVNFVTDARGEASFVLPGGGGPSTFYAQYLILDPNATEGVSFSNALQINQQM